MIEAVAEQLLGGHVAQLALDLALLGHLHAPARFGHAEVDDVRGPVGPDENVVRRNVAVHDAEGFAAFVARFVRRVQPMQDPHDDRRRDGGRDEVVVGAHRAKEPCEGFALHVLHHDEELSLRRDDVQRGHHVRVTNPRGQPSLV